MTWMSPVLAVSIPECFASVYACFTEAWFREARYLIVYPLKPVVAGQDKETRYLYCNVKLVATVSPTWRLEIHLLNADPNSPPKLPIHVQDPFHPCRSAGAASTWKLKKPLWPSERPSKT
ncbi:hypothetical protein BJX62DRAFT_231688 [Aspergillus germanicus]